MHQNPVSAPYTRKSYGQSTIVEDVPVPKDIGLRNIMLISEAPENWYTDSTQARNTSSSVMGACKEKTVYPSQPQQ